MENCRFEFEIGTDIKFTFESVSVMNIKIKLPQKLLDVIRQDLSRHHKFAHERVGFACAKTSRISDHEFLILFTEYHSVPDENYIDDKKVGAKITGNAIRQAMEKVLLIKQGIFHVHAHWLNFGNRLDFSHIDILDHTRLIPSFQAVGPSLAHGAFLIGGNQCTSRVWLPGSSKGVPANTISVVGFPFEIYKDSKL